MVSDETSRGDDAADLDAPLTEAQLESIRQLNLTSCDFVGDSGCSDPDCWRCHSSMGPENLRCLAENIATAALLSWAWQLRDANPTWMPGCGEQLMGLPPLMKAALASPHIGAFLREPAMTPSENTPTLVSVLQAPHAGMIICHDHLRQIAAGAVIAHVEFFPHQVAFWGHRCLMCCVTPVTDRVCENDACRKPLHPQWPAVYCCNDCALEDA